MHYLGKYAEYLVTYHRKIQSVLRYFYVIHLLFNVFSVCLELNIKNNIFNIYLFLLFFSHAQLVKCEDLIFHTQVAPTMSKFQRFFYTLNLAITCGVFQWDVLAFSFSSSYDNHSVSMNVIPFLTIYEAVHNLIYLSICLLIYLSFYLSIYLILN